MVNRKKSPPPSSRILRGRVVDAIVEQHHPELEDETPPVPSSSIHETSPSQEVPVAIETPSTATGKRPYVSNDNDEVLWVNKPRGTQFKSTKQRRMVFAARQVMPWPKWLPEKMKSEILSVNQGPNNAAAKAELMACVRTWVRRYFWQIRNLSREGRDAISMGFGTNKTQVKDFFFLLLIHYSHAELTYSEAPGKGNGVR